MAAWSYYPEHGKHLATFGHDAKAGDVVETSVGSFAYSQPRGAFGWRGCEFTRYVLPEPIGINKFGEPLFDMNGLGVCPLDDSPQTKAAEQAAWERENLRVGYAPEVAANLARQLAAA